MSIIKKCLIIIIIVIFLYVIWQLIILRINFKKNFDNLSKENFQEGLSLLSMFSSEQQNELTNMKSTSMVTINDMNKNKYSLAIKEFCIKSSYNTAVSGKYVSTDAISYIINRGVRYVDFEVFYLDINSLNNNKKNSDFQPVVGYSTDPTFVQLNTLNVIPLVDALSSCLQAANTSKNSKDPFIINLRIKSNNENVYSSVAKCIDNALYPNLYTDTNHTISLNETTRRNTAVKISSHTDISDIMGKIIISLDTTYYPQYVTAKCDIPYNVDDTCNYLLTNYVNIENNSDNMILSYYSYMINKKVIIPYNDGSTSIDNIYIAIPDSEYFLNKKKENPKFGDWLLKYGYPIIPYQFYLNDSSLEDYETFFNDNKSAFVSLSDSIIYFKKKLSN